MGKGREEGRASSPRQHGAAARHNERGVAPTAAMAKRRATNWARGAGGFGGIVGKKKTAR
jgi:hypothetical protein